MLEAAAINKNENAEFPPIYETVLNSLSEISDEEIDPKRGKKEKVGLCCGRRKCEIM